MTQLLWMMGDQLILLTSERLVDKHSSSRKSIKNGFMLINSKGGLLDPKSVTKM